MITKTKEELRSTMTEKATNVANLLTNGAPADDVSAAKKLALNAVKTYNAKICEEQYSAWAAESDDPVQVACRNLYVKDTVGVKYAIGEDGKYAATFPKKEQKINLVTMMEVIGHEKFHAGTWYDMVQKFAYIMANNLNRELSNSPDFHYEIKEAAQQFKFPADADPASKSSVIKALQLTVDAILYLPTTDKKGNEVNSLKITSHDYVYIRECMTKQGKKPGEVIVGNTMKMVELVVDIIHCNLTDTPLKLLAA